MDEKRVLYERLVMKQISTEDYKVHKATIDIELGSLQEIHSKLKIQTSQMQMDEKKNARTELAHEVSEVGGLTAGLAETLIDRVYIYPDNQVEIVWKTKGFCMEGMRWSRNGLSCTAVWLTMDRTAWTCWTANSFDLKAMQESMVLRSLDVPAI